MPATYEPIATTTLGSTNTTVTFSSIPSTYTDLRLVFIGLSASGAPDVYIRFNSDTSSIYSGTYLQGNGTTASSFFTSSQTAADISAGVGWSTTTYSFLTLDIFSYTGSTFKTFLNSETADRNGSGALTRVVGSWRSTSAINRIDLTFSNAGSFAVGTTATLFGIKAA